MRQSPRDRNPVCCARRRATVAALRSVVSRRREVDEPDVAGGLRRNRGLRMKRLITILFCALASLAITGASAAAPTTQGVVKWRFQVTGGYVDTPPVVGPDGGVVVASSSGNLYSLTADGDLRWVRSGGADGLSIGADGTVYVGSM